MIYRTIRATLATPGIAETLVISPDREALEQAAFLGARTMRQRSQGLNAGSARGPRRRDRRRRRRDRDPADRPAARSRPTRSPSSSPRSTSSGSGRSSSSPRTATAGARTASSLAPPDAIEPAFGGDSRAAHEACARDAGARYVELEGPLGLDLDTPDDLLLIEALADDATEVLETDGRCRLTAGSRSSRSTGSRRSCPGDDLAALLGDAIDRTPGATPLREDDVLVVTQKIVSKAEGAIVDLTTVEPRPQAIEFATTYDRDPRQIEVVLREAVRVVRMANGVLITETHHGFVCANGGIDASNVGPASGQVVTLLPRDPDASATRHPRGHPATASASTSRSSSATRSAGRGAGGSWTSRSASPGCCRSRTCAASPTTTAA